VAQQPIPRNLGFAADEIEEKGLPKPRLNRLKHLAGYLVIAAAVGWFGRGIFSPNLPGEDFGGGVAWLWQIKGWVDGSLPFSIWVPNFFCGTSFVLALSTILWFLAYVPFALFFDLVLAVKVGTLFYLALAGVSMHVVTWKFSRNHFAAVLAGLVYALHPIHVTQVIRFGHTNFPVFYPFVPLMFFFAWRLARSARPRIAAGFALSLAGAFLADFGRFVFVAPFVAATWVAGVVASRKQINGARAWAARAAAAVASGALMTGLVAFALLPSLAESGYNALMPEDEILRNVRFFSLNNPLLPFDRNGVLTNPLSAFLPRSMWLNAGSFYLGAVILAGGLAVAVSTRASRELKRVVLGAFALTAGAFWFACGVYSPWRTAGRFFGRLLRDPGFKAQHSVTTWFALVVFVFLVLVAVAWCRRIKREKTSTLAWFVVSLVAGVVLFTAPFLFLRRWVPPFNLTRSPTWFATKVPAFGAAVLAGAFVVFLWRVMDDAKSRAAAFVILLALVYLDFKPYLAQFGSDDPRLGTPASHLEGLKAVSNVIKRDPDDCRSLVLSPYSPFTDMRIIYTGRPAAWGWLLWTSPLRTWEFFGGTGGIFRDWQRNGVGALPRIKRRAGVANVKYIIIYNSAEDDDGAAAAERGGRKGRPRFRLLVNEQYRPYVQLYEDDPSEAPSVVDKKLLGGGEASAQHDELGPDRHLVKVKLARPALVMISESFYPGWTVEVDGSRKPMKLVEGTFQAVSVPAGEHELEFVYREPSYFMMGRVVSIISAGAVFLLLVFSPGGRKNGVTEKAESPPDRGSPRGS